MNVLYTLNDGFVPQVAAGITSVCENNKDIEKIHFYLMSLNISRENEEKLEKYVKRYDRDITFIELETMQNYFDFPIDTTGWNPIVLARLLLDQLLPSDLQRILYLDGDTIVRGSLKDLWETDLGDYSIAAAPEPTYSAKYKEALGLQGIPYCNAGVLLIDLNNWRKNRTGEEILHFYKEHDGKLFSNDQDAINGSQKDRIYLLSMKYNYFNIYDQYSYCFLKSLCDYDFFPENIYDDAKEDPIIVHYLGEERPWRIGNYHRFKNDYDRYLSLTPWKGENYEAGWKVYFIAWNTFNFLTKYLPGMRYKIITSLIPYFLEHRAKKNAERK